MAPMSTQTASHLEKRMNCSMGSEHMKLPAMNKCPITSGPIQTMLSRRQDGTKSITGDITMLKDVLEVRILTVAEIVLTQSQIWSSHMDKLEWRHLFSQLVHTWTCFSTACSCPPSNQMVHSSGKIPLVRTPSPPLSPSTNTIQAQAKYPSSRSTTSDHMLCGSSTT